MRAEAVRPAQSAQVAGVAAILVGEERDGQHHRQQQKQRQPEAVPENSAVGTHNPHSPSKDYAYSVGRKGRAYTLL